MVLGRHTRFLHRLRPNEVSLVKCLIDEGNSFIAVSLKSSLFNPSTFPRFSGKFSKLELPERSRHSIEFKQQMALDKHTRFWQLRRVNEVRPIKPPIDEGSFIIVVKSKLRLCKHSMFPINSGILSFEQNFRLRRTRFLRIPTDG